MLINIWHLLFIFLVVGILFTDINLVIINLKKNFQNIKKLTKK